MATYEAIYNTIRSRFETEVEIPQALTNRVRYDNDTGSKPKGKLWVRWKIQTSESRQISMGGTASDNRDRVLGMGVAQIFSLLGDGDKAALQLADVIEAKFNKVTDGAVVFKVPSVIPVGVVGSEYQVNVECPFYSDR